MSMSHSSSQESASRQQPLCIAREGLIADLDELLARIRQMRAGQSVVEIARKTRIPSETVRRYLSGQRPSAEFLMAICEFQGVSALWLLTGEGPMMQSEVTQYYLSKVDEVQLCKEVGRRIMLATESLQKPDSATCSQNVHHPVVK